MYDFALTTENSAVAKEWERLKGSVFQRQRRFVTDPGAVAWLERSRSYAWFREVRLQTSGTESVKCYEEKHANSDITAALCRGLREAMTPGIELDAARNWLSRTKADFESASSSQNSGEREIRKTVCGDLELIVDYYARPRWFFNQGLFAGFKELLGPKVYPDADRLREKPEVRRQAAVRLGYAMWFFGPSALLNEKGRDTFLRLEPYSIDFGLSLVLASGALDPGSGRPPRSPDSPESETQRRMHERKRLYHAAYAFVCDGTDPGKRARARRILEEKGCLGVLKRLEDGVSEAEAEDYALRIVVKTEPGLTRKSLKKSIDSDLDFSL
jgi:hypothetical protein